VGAQCAIAKDYKVLAVGGLGGVGGTPSPVGAIRLRVIDPGAKTDVALCEELQSIPESSESRHGHVSLIVPSTLRQCVT